MMRPSYLVVAFLATGGKQGEDLGSDEEQIVLFVYLLYDITNNKVRKPNSNIVVTLYRYVYIRLHMV